MSDKVAAHELYLFAINESELYRQRILPIIANLKKKIKKGNYNPSLALKLWRYAADDAAKRYTHGGYGRGPGYGIFTTATRNDAAREMQEYYEEHLREGTNPAPRIGTARSSRRSQITGRAPSQRLVSRRRRNARRGYFPNPEKMNAGRGRSDTHTSSDVRSPTRTSTSTHARTAGNITVTGGAGAGATTRVTVRKNPMRRKRRASPAQLRARVNFARMARAGKFTRGRRGKRRTAGRKYRGAVGAQFGSLPIIVKQGGSVVAAFQGTPLGVKRAKQYARIIARHGKQAAGVYRR